MGTEAAGPGAPARAALLAAKSETATVAALTLLKNSPVAFGLRAGILAQQASTILALRSLVAKKPPRYIRQILLLGGLETVFGPWQRGSSNAEIRAFGAIPLR